jgi:hypothetical protein
MTRLVIRENGCVRQEYPASAAQVVKSRAARQGRHRTATAIGLTQIAVAAIVMLHAPRSYAGCAYTSGGANPLVATNVTSNSTVVCSGAISTGLGQGPGGGTLANPANPANNGRGYGQ